MLEQQEQELRQNRERLSLPIGQPDRFGGNPFIDRSEPGNTPVRGAEAQSPVTSTPSTGVGSTGAIKKSSYFNRDKSISGIFSPLRGDDSAPAGTFYPLTPYGHHDTFMRMIQDNIRRIEEDEAARRRRGNQSIKEDNEEDIEDDKEEDTDEDDNHGAAGNASQVLAISGPSVIEQTRLEETPEKKIKFEVVEVNTEVEALELGDDEDIPDRDRPQLRSSKRKQSEPKKKGPKK